MIIWRGWGVLAALYGFAAGIFFVGLASTLVSDEALPFSAAVGVAGASVATWFTGQALNQKGPAKRVAAWRRRREEQLHDLVESGRFSLGPGQPQPQSLEEARAQSAALLEHETALAMGCTNVHTLFFIPMQYIAFLYGVGAIVLLVVGVVGLVG